MSGFRNMWWFRNEGWRLLQRGERSCPAHHTAAFGTLESSEPLKEKVLPKTATASAGLTIFRSTANTKASNQSLCLYLSPYPQNNQTVLLNHWVSSEQPRTALEAQNPNPSSKGILLGWSRPAGMLTSGHKGGTSAVVPGSCRTSLSTSLLSEVCYTKRCILIMQLHRTERPSSGVLQTQPCSWHHLPQWLNSEALCRARSFLKPFQEHQ